MMLPSGFCDDELLVKSGLSVSPRNSAYGFSERTTTPTAVPCGTDLPSCVYETLFGEDDAACIPWKMLVPPMASAAAPVTPCHARVHPPDWIPTSLPPCPATTILADLESGKTLSSFCRSTIDSCTAWRAIWRCAALP